MFNVLVASILKPSNMDLFLLIVPVLLLIFLLIKTWAKHHPLLPPGPVPFPIIGNVLQLSPSNPHVQLTRLARSHGQLMSLKFGTKLFVVASSPEAAMEILKTNDRVLTGREVMHVSFARDPSLNHLSLLWAFDCNQQWNLIRRVCRTAIFSVKSVHNQSGVREKIVEELVNVLKSKQGVPVKIVDFIEICNFNLLAEIFLSQHMFVSFDDIEKGSHGTCGFITEGMKLCSTPNVSDFFPLFAGLDLQGIKRKAVLLKKHMCSLWAGIVERRRLDKTSPTDAGPRDFLDALIDSEFTDDQIDCLFMELFTAGTHSTTATIEWCMAEIIKNPQVHREICAELDREIDGSFVKESDLTRLSYLRATVQETLRLHPAGPLLLPHRATETCQVMNYTIPKDTQVLVNVWNISRDPNVWEDAASFIPERFLDPDEMDLKRSEFKYFPFSAGRRTCPGQPLAIRQVEIMVANLFHCFEWSLKDGMLPHQLNMKESFIIVLEMEESLVVTPKYKY